MKNKNIYIFLLMFLVCILSISAISATENTSKEVTNTDNKEYSLETTTNQYNDVSNSNDNVELKKEENVNDNRQGESGTDKTTAENDDPLSFSDLNTTINGNTNSTIYLSHNYKYNSATDSGFTSGIVISRNLTVYGNGVTLDGNNMARIFHVTDSKLNVNFYNINFINGKADKGGAINHGNAYNCTFTGNKASYGGAIFYGRACNCTFNGNNATSGGAINQGTAYNCTFTGNNATYGGAIWWCDAYKCTFTENYAGSDGGAIHIGDAYNCTFNGNNATTNGGAINQGNAYNCTFTGNNAPNGRAMFQGTAIFCTFNGDTTYDTTIIPAVINVINYTSPYMSGEKLKFNLTANGTLYDGFNTTIKIYKDGSLVKTVYGLTGEGWIVDLIHGKYTAVLSLTDYPEEKSVNATITVIGHFNELNTTINGNNNSTIYLSTNYKYNSATDSAFTSGILISRNLNVYGNGITLDGNNMARIFDVVYSELNVNFYNINFINGKGYSGGAISQGNAYNCNFTGNNATSGGGAIWWGNAYNCTFTGNKAKYDGGAISSGNAYNCTFTENYAGINGGAITARNGGAISWGDAYNCTFTGNNATSYGGAIYSGNAYNCTFTGNTVGGNGGAICRGNATNCIFTGNNATRGGGGISSGNAYNCTFLNNHGDYGDAMDDGTAVLCTFNGDTTYDTTIIPAVINVINYTSPYMSGEKLKFNLTANGILYDGFNTTIKIYKDGALVKTVFGLSGEGWIVDLELGEYTAELSLTDRPEVNSTNATISISKENTTVIISSIPNVKVGQTVTINYTTNSNSTVTIKINGTPITSNKFIPTTVGVYNVTVEVLENDYYTAASNETTFTAEKTNTTIVISPISDVKVGKEVTIEYDTNSNGTVIIKVNGTPIVGGKFTPSTAGVYNVTVEVLENDYYTAASNETTFTAEKTNTTIVISPISDVKVGQKVIINYVTNSNGTATIKVNGEVIPDGNFTPTKAGTYNLTIEIAENDYYTAATNQTTFTVGKLESQIITSPVTTTYNVGKNLVITLKDENGKPIANATVTVNLGSSKKYTTDAKGQIKINVATLTPKTYNAKITYAGSDNYKSSTKTVKVTVKKATPKITAKSASYKLKIKTKKYTVNLKDNVNKALKNTKVTLKVNGKTYSVKTNSKGQGVFKITNLKKIGSYSAVITVPSNTYYNKVTKNVKIIVKQ